MVLFEFELTAALIGGVVYNIYWLYRLWGVSQIRKNVDMSSSGDTGKSDFKGDAAKVAEPSPEPQPGEEESDPSTITPSVKIAPHAIMNSQAAQAPFLHWMVAGLVLLCLVLLACNLGNLDPAHVQEIVTPVMPSEARLAKASATDGKDPTGAFQPTVPLASLASKVVPLETKTQDPVISWKLNRQLLAIQTIGGHAIRRNAYWGRVTIGTPPVSFKMVFDTGSGQLIIPSTYCKTDSCRMHTRYKRSVSSTGKDIDSDGTVVQPGAERDHIDVTFGTGEIGGVVFGDNVCVQKSVVTTYGANLLSTNETNEDVMGCSEMRVIGAIDMPDDPFKSFDFDGILGLGLDGLSQTPEFNFVTTFGKMLQIQGYKKPFTFAVFLAEDPKEESEITFGGWIENQHVDEHVWAPVHMPELGHWMVELKSLRIDGNVVDYCADGQCRAVMDTGTSLLAVPKSAFKILFNLLKHPATDGMCRGPGPSLQFALQGITLELEPHDYAMLSKPKQMQLNQTNMMAKNDNNTMLETNQTNHALNCTPMLMAVDMPEPAGPKLFILGEPILKKYHTVYDAESKQIGFSHAVHPQKK